MNKIGVAALVSLFLSFSAYSATEISWEDLEPEIEEQIEDPFEDLSDDQMMSLSMVARYREILEIQDKLSPGGLEELETETQKLKEWGIDVDGLLARRLEIIDQMMELASKTNPALDGENVKIPGYLLPLEYDDNRVTEFLLVPYVGACIHTPPPPPNQIVYVKSEFGFASSDLYEPIWVTGTMKAQSSERSLSYIDGESDIPVAYTLDADEVIPYEY